MAQTCILVVEDDPDIRELICHTLQRQDYSTLEAENGLVAWHMLQEKSPDLMLVDLMMPDMDGITLTKKLRTELFSTVPIIMVTAKGLEDDVVQGLLAGADDYVVKPFGMKELVARVNALLRRMNPGGGLKEIKHGPLTLFQDAHRVTLNGEELKLTPTEYGLLTALVSHPEVVLSRVQLLDQVWGRDSDVFDRTVDVHLKNLRHKLKDLGDQVETVRGLGYAWREKKS